VEERLMVSRERFMRTLRELVSAKSISGTVDENLAVDKIVELISEIPYFQQNPENLSVIPVEEDRFNRGFVSALIKSNTGKKDTIIITGHLDVVGIEDFGHLKEIAFDIDRITSRIMELNPDDAAVKDLESGEWIFGRGVADMKYGIALCIEVLRWFSQKSEIPGNILFLAVPGEESNSEGMLAAVPYLEKMQDEGYKFKGCFVTESTVPRWSGDSTKRIYTGTIGKVMPMFFCRGKESHVCEPLSSVNPNLVISEITRMIENNPDFCTQYKGECNPPPVCLKQMDLKELYNVQTPLYAVGYYNLLTLKLKASELVEKLKVVAAKGFSNSLQLLAKNAHEYAKLTGKDPIINEYPANVITFDELWEAVLANHKDLENDINKKIDLLQNKNLDNQQIAIQITKELLEMYEDKNPIVVVGFAPPFYPTRVIEGNTEDERLLLDAINATIEYGNNDCKETIEKCYFYDAICDLSYTGLGEDEGAETIALNMPSLRKNYFLPMASLGKLNIPGAVFGGLGKDFHKNTERLHVPYSVDVVPKLYEFMIDKIFGR
jgi:arginine utilization protein RocB